MSNKVIGRTNRVYEEVAAYPQPPMAEAELLSLKEMVRPFHSSVAMGLLMKALFALAGYSRFRILGKDNLEVLLRDCHFRGFGYMPTNQVASLLIKDEPINDKQEKVDCLDRAARLIIAAIAFREDFFKGELIPDSHKGKPREMGQYANLFGTHLVFKRDLYLYKSPLVDTINVVVNGNYYILNICEFKGENNCAQIKKALKEIVLNANEEKPDNKNISPGIIAASSISTNRKTWQKSSNRKVHKENLEKLRNTLFTLCLDMDTTADTDCEAARALHSMNYGNRWHHASMQIVVLANAKAGVILNFDASIDGNVMIRTGIELYHRSQLSRQAKDLFPHFPESASFLHREKFRYEKLNWKIDEQCLNDAKKELNEVTDSQQATFYLQGLGKQAYIKAGLSPVPTFVLAMILALNKIEGRIPKVAQAMDMSRFRYMGISGAEVTTPETEIFVKKFMSIENSKKFSNDLGELLLTAIQSQMNACKERRNQITQDIVTHIFVKSRRLHQKIAIACFELLLSLKGESYKKDIMISHPIVSSEVPILGRPGARLMYVNYFGLHYQIDDEKTTMTFMPGVDWKIQNAQVAKLIEEYAKQLMQLGMAHEKLGKYSHE